MNRLLAKLPAFALPFVTRSLRGGRGKRYAAISLLIAAATLFMGLWIALGSGSFEQSLRVELGLERDEWTRQQREFVVFTHDERSFEFAQEEVERMRRAGGLADPGDSYSIAGLVRDHGRQVVANAAWSGNAWAPEHRELRQRARTLLDPQQIQPWTEYQHFPWEIEREVATLERVLDREGVPEVVRYESPLGLGDALKIVGFMAGLILTACATVFGPLLVAVQQAQERNENTLTPLTGTALNPLELALGLAAGPTAVVAIFAAPQLLVFGACALMVGEPVVALSLLVALAASGVFLTFAAQLLGHLVGHRRTPGVVAIALMSLLGVAWLIGAAFLTELEPDTAGFATVLPTLGLAGLLTASFGQLDVGYFQTLHYAALAWSAAALVFAGLLLIVLSHKLAGRPGAPLGRPAALLGALTCIALINLAIPFHVREEGLRMYLGLAALALPFTVLLMARVPVGDDPPRMRRVPVPTLLGEFAGWGVAHVLAAIVLTNFDVGHTLHPIALLWIGWCVLVLGLIAIRVVSIPATIPTHLFIGFCAATLIMGFAQAIFWAFDRNHDIEHVFALSDVSPMLGVAQVAVTFAVPLLLLRSLRKNLGSLRAF